MKIVEEVTEEAREITQQDIDKLKNPIVVKDSLMINVTPDSLEFSRIAVQAAAQTIKQSLKTIERERFYDKFKDKE
jgi:RecA/RadA recombinase